MKHTFAIIIFVLSLIFATSSFAITPQVYYHFPWYSQDEFKQEWTVTSQRPDLCSATITSGVLKLSDNANTENGVCAKRSFEPMSGKVVFETTFTQEVILSSGSPQLGGLKITVCAGEQTVAVLEVNAYEYFSVNGNSFGTLALTPGETYTLDISMDFDERRVDYYLTSTAFNSMSGDEFSPHSGAWRNVNQSMPQGVAFADNVSLKTTIKNPKWDFTHFGISKIPRPALSSPRLFTDAEELDEIRSRVEQYPDLYRKITEDSQRYTASSFTGSSVSSYGYVKRNIAENTAFRFLLYGEEEVGRKAIDMAKAIITKLTIGSPTNGSAEQRELGFIVQTVSIVYDWCQGLMTSDEKTQFVSWITSSLKKMELHLPLDPDLIAISAHSTDTDFLRLTMAAAISLYGNDREVFDLCAAQLTRRFTEVKNYFYESGYDNQGYGYIESRYSSFVALNIIFGKMGYPDVFAPNTEKVAYSALYASRPDGKSMIDGDVYQAGNPAGIEKWQYLESFGMPASYYNNPFFSNEFFRQWRYVNTPEYSTWYNPSSMSRAMEFLFFSAKEEGLDKSELPLTRYFSDPHAVMIARTGWNKDGAIVYMKIGGYNQQGHQHYDSGQFQIFYKAPLAIDSGLYDYVGMNATQYKNYTRRSIAHNVMLVYDPNENCYDITNDGGQRPIMRYPQSLNEILRDTMYKTGQVLSHEFGPDVVTPEYSYIKGDIGMAYANSVNNYTGSQKVSDYKRAMMFVNTSQDGRPGALFVLDKITASDKNFKKYWLLHSQTEPNIIGNSTTINNGEGRITNTVLSPEVDIVKVGGDGHEFDVLGTDFSPDPFQSGRSFDTFEAGRWRIQQTPKSLQNTDVFLNVIDVGDEGTSPRIPVKIENNDIIGGILDNILVTFSKTGTKLSFVQEFQTDKPLKCHITDLIAGTWNITLNGTNIAAVSVSEDGGVAYFQTESGGIVKLDYVSKEAVKPPFGVRVLASSPDMAEITWNPSSMPNASYNIYINGALAGNTRDLTYDLRFPDKVPCEVAVGIISDGYTLHSETVTAVPGILPPADIKAERNEENLAVSWKSISNAKGYDVKIDDVIYVNKTSSFIAPESPYKTHRVYIRANLDVPGVWSPVINYNQFDDEAKAVGGYGNIWQKNSTGTAVLDGEGSLLFTDTTANRTVVPCAGRVILNTSYTALSEGGSLEVRLLGSDIKGVEAIATTAAFSVNEGEKVSITIAADVESKTYSYTAQCDGWIGGEQPYTGEFDSETGTMYRINLPFKNTGCLFINKIAFISKSTNMVDLVKWSDNVPAEYTANAGVYIRDNSVSARCFSTFTDKSIPVAFIIARYDKNGKLCEVKEIIETLEPYREKIFCSEMQKIANDDFLKGFLWFGGEIRPLEINKTLW